MHIHVYIHTFVHIHFTDPIAVITQPNKKQDMTTQQTTHTDKLKTYDRTPNNTIQTQYRLNHYCLITTLKMSTITIECIKSYISCGRLLD